VVHPIVAGARIRHCSGMFAVKNGRLQIVKARRSGEKDKPAIEYLVLKELITRWRKAAKK